MSYHVELWTNECEPPEAGKAWLTVRDGDDNEIAVIVHRAPQEEIDALVNDPRHAPSDIVRAKENAAYKVAEALNFHDENAEYVAQREAGVS